MKCALWQISRGFLFGFFVVLGQGVVVVVLGFGLLCVTASIYYFFNFRYIRTASPARLLFYLVILQPCLFIKITIEGSSILGVYCGCYHMAYKPKLFFSHSSMFQCVSFYVLGAVSLNTIITVFSEHALKYVSTLNNFFYLYRFG